MIDADAVTTYKLDIKSIYNIYFPLSLLISSELPDIWSMFLNH